MDNLTCIIEELALSGSIYIPGTPRTQKRWFKRINEKLEREHYDWRVKLESGVISREE